MRCRCWVFAFSLNHESLRARARVVGGLYQGPPCKGSRCSTWPDASHSTLDGENRAPALGPPCAVLRRGERPVRAVTLSGSGPTGPEGHLSPPILAAAPPVAVPPPTAEAGDTCLLFSAVLSPIPRALIIALAPPAGSPLPLAFVLHGRRGGVGDKRCDGGRPGLCAIFTPPPSLLCHCRRLRGCSPRVTRARALCRRSMTRYRPPLVGTPAAHAGIAGGVKEGGVAVPHAVVVRCAQWPPLQIMPRARGGGGGCGIATLGNRRDTID